MKAIQIFRKIVKSTGVRRVIVGFVILFLISAFVIKLAEPHIETYGDACWYCFSVISTCGFGDIVVYSTVAKIMSVLLSIYSVVIIAMLTGVIVNYYNKLIESRVKGSLEEMLQKLTHLSDLSKEELDEISEQVKKIL